jgi:hypothetical protein
VKLPPLSQDVVEPTATHLALANGHYDVVTRFALVELSRRGAVAELPIAPARKPQVRRLSGPGTLVVSGLAGLLVLVGGLLIGRLI